MNTKEPKSKIALILAAAGTGSRFGGDSPKQFQEIMNLPLYMWSIFTFGSIEALAPLVVVTSTDSVDKVVQEINETLEHTNLEKLVDKISVIAGGQTRQESVYKGLKYLEDICPDYVLIHDAARPFVSKSSIENIITSATKYGAATLAVPVTDTIKLVENGEIQKTLDRSVLYSAQTPQAGRFDWLVSAHSKAQENCLEVTDDATLLELNNRPVKIVEGTKSNMKITVKEDMIIGQSIASDLFGQINALLRTKNNLTSEI